MSLFIIKLGGSSITFKDKPFSINEDGIKNIAEALADAKERYFLIHGGGSWGHPAAAIYGLSSFIYCESNKGVSFTKIKMQQLSVQVQKFLLEKGISTFYFPAQLLEVLNRDEILEMIEKSVYPLTYGDVIYERNKGFRVIGGDEIALKLSDKFPVKKVVFIMGTPGILDENGNIIEKISIVKSKGSVYIGDVPIMVGNGAEKFEKILLKLSENSPDATGGISYKLYVAYILAKKGINSAFINAADKENIIKAIKGYKFEGSVVMSDGSKE
ncbi:MAG: isopentenyl phosphate kinase [Nitrososphaeria archaeon]|nr:isopentenyl phosphate kinase [Conexivisphaerales archaeon]